jgi:hypothetical protein
LRDRFAIETPPGTTAAQPAADHLVRAAGHEGCTAGARTFRAPLARPTLDRRCLKQHRIAIVSDAS